MSRAGLTGFEADVAARDWDAIAAELGMPEHWREQGFDSAEYMARPDSVYRLSAAKGSMRCPYPNCNFKRHDVEAMFRHVHGPHHQRRTDA